VLHNASMPAPGRCLCAFGSILSEEQSRFTSCKRAFFVAWLGDSEITPTRPWRVGVKLRYPLLLGLGLLRPCRLSLSLSRPCASSLFRAPAPFLSFVPLRHFSLSRPCAISLFRAPAPFLSFAPLRHFSLSRPCARVVALSRPCARVAVRFLLVRSYYNF